MSSVKVQGATSGTGIFTVTSPATNTDRTLTLPDQTGTVLTNAGPYTASSSASNGAVTIDASNNVGIGTSSPAVRFQVKVATNANCAIDNNGGTARLDFFNDAASANVDGQIQSTSLAFLGANGAERARIDSSGSLLVNTTSSTVGGQSTRFGVVGSNNATIAVDCTASSGASGLHIRRSVSNGEVATFDSGTTRVGNISITGSATAYNTSSDYRLKDDVVPMAGALARVASLNPVAYKWKSTGEVSEGFIAHELAEVVPQCVTGEKDAVDADGNPVYQGIDTSFLVATLTAAIQELKAEVDALKAQLGAQA